jgi:hypothetical protein
VFGVVDVAINRRGPEPLVQLSCGTTVGHIMLYTKQSCLFGAPYLHSEVVNLLKNVGHVVPRTVPFRLRTFGILVESWMTLFASRIDAYN